MPYTVKVRDTREQSHPDGWLLELVLPPNVWIGMITKGQQSTDSTTAGQPRQGTTSLQEDPCPPSVRRNGTVRTYAGSNVDTLAESTSRHHIATLRSAVKELLAECKGLFLLRKTRGDFSPQRPSRIQCNAQMYFAREGAPKDPSTKHRRPVR